MSDIYNLYCTCTCIHQLYKFMYYKHVLPLIHVLHLVITESTVYTHRHVAYNCTCLTIVRDLLICSRTAFQLDELWPQDSCAPIAILQFCRVSFAAWMTALPRLPFCKYEVHSISTLITYSQLHPPASPLYVQTEFIDLSRRFEGKFLAALIVVLEVFRPFSTILNSVCRLYRRCKSYVIYTHAYHLP